MLKSWLYKNEKISGYPLFKLHENQSIVPLARNKQLITKIYPLHDDEDLKKLAGTWYMPRWFKQPIGKPLSLMDWLIINA